MDQHLEISPSWQETAPIHLVLKKPDLFTPRKAEILQLILDGYGEKQICETLGMSPSTLKNHMYGTDTSHAGMEKGNSTAMGIFGIVEYENRKAHIEPAKCRPQNTPTLIATLIKHGVVEVE